MRALALVLLLACDGDGRGDSGDVSDKHAPQVSMTPFEIPIGGTFTVDLVVLDERPAAVDLELIEVSGPVDATLEGRQIFVQASDDDVGEVTLRVRATDPDGLQGETAVAGEVYLTVQWGNPVQWGTERDDELGSLHVDRLGRMWVVGGGVLYELDRSGAVVDQTETSGYLIGHAVDPGGAVFLMSSIPVSGEPHHGRVERADGSWAEEPVSGEPAEELERLRVHGAVVVAGAALGARERGFVRRIGLDGTGGRTVWFETPDGSTRAWDAVITDQGVVYAVGTTTGSMDGANAGGEDAWVARVDPDGSVAWRRQVGSEDDDGWYAVVALPGGIVVGGQVRGGERLAGADAALAWYDDDGTPGWTAEASTSRDDRVLDLAELPDGSIAFAGYQDRYPYGETFISRALMGNVTPGDGNVRWATDGYTGSYWHTVAHRVAASGREALYAGDTDGDLSITNLGGYDLWAMRLDALGDRH